MLLQVTAQFILKFLTVSQKTAWDTSMGEIQRWKWRLFPAYGVLYSCFEMKVVIHPKFQNNCYEAIWIYWLTNSKFPGFTYCMKLLAILSCHEVCSLPNIKHSTVWLTLPAVIATAGHSNCRRGSEYKNLLQMKPRRISNGQNLITQTWPACLLCKSHNQNLLDSHSGISS